MRAFFAVNLPDDIRARAYAAFEPMRSASLPVRWVTSESLHITLNFLGSISQTEREDAVAAAGLTAGQVGPFGISLEGAGVFPNLRSPSVWWIGCVSPGLVRLQGDLTRRVKEAGFTPEGRKYSPHITTGRTKRDARAGGTHVASLLDSISISSSWMVSSIELMESNVSARGAHYTVMDSFELTGER